MDAYRLFKKARKERTAGELPAELLEHRKLFYRTDNRLVECLRVRIKGGLYEQHHGLSLLQTT